MPPTLRRAAPSRRRPPRPKAKPPVGGPPAEAIAPPAIPVPTPRDFADGFSSLAARWEELRVALASHPDDPDLVHDLRVASRRVSERLALRPERSGGKRIRRRLRRLVDRLGAPREADVTAALLERLAAGDPGAGELARRFADDRTDRPGDGEPIAPGEAFAAEVAAAAAADAALALSDPDRLAAELAAAVAQRLAGRLAPFAGSGGEVHGPEALHRLRIAAKKLRYLAELLPGDDAERLATTAREFQRASGEWHDVAVAERWLGEAEAIAFEDGDEPLAAAAGRVRARALAERLRWKTKSLARLSALRKGLRPFVARVRADAVPADGADPGREPTDR